MTAPSWALAAADAFDPPPLVDYTPHGAAAKLFEDRSPEVVLSGPAGTGKSMACLMRLHLAALTNRSVRCLVVRKTAVSLASTTLDTYEKRVATKALADHAVSWYGGSPKEPASYRYANGSRIVVGGMDKPEKVLSSEYDLIFVDEATELSITDWETLGTRLRNGVLPWQQQIAACNPGPPSHWIKQRSTGGPLVMHESRHEDNPKLYQNGELTDFGRAYMAKLDNLTGVRKLRLRHGQWAAAEGTIYEGWDDAVHLVDRFDIPDSWTRWWTVDFGFTNPFVLQWWAEDGDGRLFMYRELYRTRRLVEDHALDALLAVTAVVGEVPERETLTAKDVLDDVRAGLRHWIEPRPRAVICDHDAEDRATLERHVGMSTSPAKKTVSDGIQAVQARLKPAGDGRPRLFIMRDSLVERDEELDDAKRPCSTLEEIPGYVWLQQPGKPPKETPVKENDHGQDAKRYMVAERDLGGRPRVRWL